MGALEHVEAWCEGAYRYYLMKFVYIHRWSIVVKNKQRKKQRKNIWRTRKQVFKSSYYVSWGLIK